MVYIRVLFFCFKTSLKTFRWICFHPCSSKNFRAFLHHAFKILFLILCYIQRNIVEADRSRKEQNEEKRHESIGKRVNHHSTHSRRLVSGARNNREELDDGNKIPNVYIDLLRLLSSSRNLLSLDSKRSANDSPIVQHVCQRI